MRVFFSVLLGLIALFSGGCSLVYGLMILPDIGNLDGYGPIFAIAIGSGLVVCVGCILVIRAIQK